LALIGLLLVTLRPGDHDAAAQTASGGHRLAGGHWLASWGAAPEAPSADSELSLRGLQHVTLREIVLASSAGAAVRIHLANTFGTRPLVIGRAAVAVAGPRGRLRGAGHQVTFDGADSIRIPVGASVVSDPVRLEVHPLERLAVSLYLPARTGPLTYNGAGEQTGFVGAGDDVLDPSADWSTRRVEDWYVLSGVDTLSPPQYVGTVVAIGDSITAGYASTLDSFGAWPDDLARRMARRRGERMAVIDEGIDGNRLLTASPCCGPSTLTRFSPDVVDQSGVRAVVLLEGINDIGFSHGHSPLTVPHTDVSAAQIIAGDERIIAAAHAAGLRIYGATLLPFKGAFYWTPAGEATREAVNHWILTSRAFDGVINFAGVMADPGHPETLDPADNSGDDLHPNNAGYQRMADAVSLAMLLDPARLAAGAAPHRTHRPAHSAARR
jgi:lysophospholipase L1-like esterase